MIVARGNRLAINCRPMVSLSKDSLVAMSLSLFQEAPVAADVDMDAPAEGPAPDPREELKEWPEFVSRLDHEICETSATVSKNFLKLYTMFLHYFHEKLPIKLLCCYLTVVILFFDILDNMLIKIWALTSGDPHLFCLRCLINGTTIRNQP